MTKEQRALPAGNSTSSLPNTQGGRCLINTSPHGIKRLPSRPKTPPVRVPLRKVPRLPAGVLSIPPLSRSALSPQPITVAHCYLSLMFHTGSSLCCLDPGPQRTNRAAPPNVTALAVIERVGVRHHKSGGAMPAPQIPAWLTAKLATPTINTHRVDVNKPFSKRPVTKRTLERKQ
jgi:hypothetical protein